METKAAEREFLQLEKEYWRAIQHRDVDAALRLIDDPCIVAGSQGVGRLNRVTLAVMMETAPYTLRNFRVLDDDVEVRMLKDDIAIIAYKVQEELTVEGKSVLLEASESSTWIRRNGRWLCALHTESIAGDPYGRDRRSVSKS